MPSVEVEGGCTIAYDTAGQGEPVVLISGLGGTAGFWSHQVDLLSQTFRVISYDHRGVAGSTGTPPYSIGQWAADLIAILDRENVARAHLIGHSTGGAIAQYAALASPQRVASLVLSGTWCRPDQRFLELFRLRRAVLLRLGEEAYGHLGELLASASPLQSGSASPPLDPVVTAARIDALLEFSGVDVSRIGAPTLVLASRDDYIVPHYMSDVLVQAIPGAKLAVFEQGGHLFPRTCAAQFNAIVKAFLSERGAHDRS